MCLHCTFIRCVSTFRLCVSSTALSSPRHRLLLVCFLHCSFVAKTPPFIAAPLRPGPARPALLPAGPTAGRPPPEGLPARECPRAAVKRPAISHESSGYVVPAPEFARRLTAVRGSVQDRRRRRGLQGRAEMVRGRLTVARWLSLWFHRLSTASPCGSTAFPLPSCTTY